jgi:aminobenzoyl-glutamate transport protein
MPREETKARPPVRRRSLSLGILYRVERWGNRLPHPFFLFLLLAFGALLLSTVASLLGVSATHPVTGKEIVAVNLLDRQGIQNIITKAVTNFTGFAPLGTVVVAMLGVGVAEKSGLFAACLKAMVAGVPSWLITAALIFAGINASVAVDAGYVVLIPLGAVLFAGLGRNPIAGLAAAFAGVSGGFSANIFLTALDPLLAGLTQEAARLYDPAYSVPVTANYYFMLASTFLLTIVGAWVSARITEPRLGPYRGGDETPFERLGAREKRGLAAAGVTILAEILLALALTLPAGAPLRNAEGALDPFFQGMVALMAIGFFLPGLAYGVTAGTIRSNMDVGKMIEETMSAMGSYIAMAFAASQFVAYFAWSNLGLIVAIGGAALLKATGLSGLPIIVLFIPVCSAIDLVLASASAKWAVVGPVFVPMLMIMGYSPELTQLAYRIGDSFTNIVTPLMPYMPLVIAYARKYQPNIGLGTILSMMLPYAAAFGLCWILFFTLWLVLGLPPGPGVPIHYPPVPA